MDYSRVALSDITHLTRLDLAFPLCVGMTEDSARVETSLSVYTQVFGVLAEYLGSLEWKIDFVSSFDLVID